MLFVPSLTSAGRITNLEVLNRAKTTSIEVMLDIRRQDRITNLEVLDIVQTTNIEVVLDIRCQDKITNLEVRTKPRQRALRSCYERP